MTQLHQELASEVVAAREAYLADPFLFAFEVLDLDYWNQPAAFHHEAVAADLANEHILFLAPRNHSKTTVLDVIMTIHYLLRYPNDRVLLAASSWDNAKVILREITEHFRHNKKLHFFFPEVKPSSKEEYGNTEEFTLPSRTKNKKEPSIDTSGPDRIITGRHYELIRAVDLVVEQNVPPAGAFEQLQKVISYFRKLPFLLDTTVPRARITVDGTRWHLSDLYGVIQEEAGFAHYRKIVIGIQDDPQGRPLPIWVHMPQVVLERIRGVCLPYWWAANFMNNPIAESALGFRQEWFRPYEDMPLPLCEKLGLRVAITVDLAISDKAGADRTAIVVTGISPRNDFYVLAIQAGRWTPYDTVNRLFELDAIWRPEYIGVESVAWQKAMAFILHHEAARRGRALAVRTLLPDANKARRAASIMNHAQAQGIYYRPEHQELVQECLRFTPAEDRGHDDLVDALAYRGQDLLVPHVEQILKEARLTHAPPTPSLTGDELLSMVREQTVEEELSPWDGVDLG